MSFGWSAGDIAAAITLAYNLIQALDTCDGAAGDYREAVSFLQDLKRTLEPLQAFTASNVVPGYGSDIEEQVAYIKEPVEVFLAAVLKYNPAWERLPKRAIIDIYFESYSGTCSCLRKS
jgi:hypothetical protein